MYCIFLYELIRKISHADFKKNSIHILLIKANAFVLDLNGSIKHGIETLIEAKISKRNKKVFRLFYYSFGMIF